jgi:hypothetical protein
MAAACRRTVLDEYTREIQVQRYVELYSAALEDVYSSNFRQRRACQAIS